MRVKVRLIKSWSIWPEKTIFYEYDGIWKEGDGNIYGIGENTMKELINFKYAEKI